jgi:hypothetical protein
MNQALTPIELEQYMKDHPEIFAKKCTAYTIRAKAHKFEIPALQHVIKGDTVKVPPEEESTKQMWKFYLPEIVQWYKLGGGRRVTKEIIRNRDYAKILQEV